MPIYQYQCQACGHELEEMQKLGEPPHKKCPKCGQMSLNKTISAVGFQLKGSGWYASGYTKSAPDTKEDAGKSENKTENKASKSTDNKNKTEVKATESKTNKSESTE